VLILFSLFPLNRTEDERDSSPSMRDRDSGVGIILGRRSVVLLNNRSARGFETKLSETVGRNNELADLSVAGPPNIVGTKEDGLAGEEDRSARVRGMKPAF